MKVVILAGGFGTRISEESHLKPKPMIEIGEKPILWHIMKEYSAYGINEFIICAGYKQHVIKEWFADYFIHTSDITFDFTKGNEMIIHNKHAEPWKVTVVDTGLNTQTGGRIKRVKDFVGDDTFMVTYGDAVGDINIDEWDKLYRKCVFEDVRYPVDRLAEDMATTYKTFKNANKVGYLDRVLYNYFIRSDSIMGGKSLKLLQYYFYIVHCFLLLLL